MIDGTNPNLFYQKETMGTTIMAIRYEGGVIACADSSTCSLTQKHHQAEFIP